MIINHPLKYKFRDLAQPAPRVVAHCQFRQCRIFKSRYYPENDAAYSLRNLVSKDRLWISAWDLEGARAFCDIEIL